LIIEGAFAVGGVLFVTTVELTVLVSALELIEKNMTTTVMKAQKR
jgi:hypothetical protein